MCGTGLAMAKPAKTMMSREDIHLIIILAVLLNIHPISTTYLSFGTVSIDFEQWKKPRFEQGGNLGCQILNRGKNLVYWGESAELI